MILMENILESGHLKDKEVNQRVILKLAFGTIQVERIGNG
jgi:hypothetical protein